MTDIFNDIFSSAMTFTVMTRNKVALSIISSMATLSIDDMMKDLLTRQSLVSE